MKRLQFQIWAQFLEGRLISTDSGLKFLIQAPLFFVQNHFLERSSFFLFTASTHQIVDEMD